MVGGNCGAIEGGNGGSMGVKMVVLWKVKMEVL